MTTTCESCSPGSARAHFNLGRAFVQEGRLQEAESAYRRTIEIEPNHADALKQLAGVYLLLQRWDDAVAFMQLALDIDPEDADARAYMGAVYLQKGDFDAAIYFFYNFPGNTMNYSSIGYDNPRIFKLHRSAEITMDLDKLDNIYRELMAIHSEEIPVTFLYPYLEIFVARKSIRGLSSPFRIDPVIHMEYLWIEEE